jgi:hypothetical protein
MLKTILNALPHTTSTATKPRENWVLAGVSWLRTRMDLYILIMHFCLNAG